MFLISYIFRKSRSAKNPEKAGMFCLSLTEHLPEPDGKNTYKNTTIITGLQSPDGEITPDIRHQLIRLIRVTYCIIENLDAKGKPYNLIDVMKPLRLAINNDTSMSKILLRADEKFPLRADLVSVGKEFKNDFQFIYSQSLSVNDIDTNSVAGFLLKKSADFRTINKLATSRSFAYTSNNIDKFNNGEDVKLSQVDKAYLYRYSNWLKQTGVSDSTQSFYLRILRTALNYAAEEKGLTIEPNLFEGLNTKIYKASKTEDIAGIDRELMSKISNTSFHDRETELVKDMFMFGFYCHGMELSDILNLKKSNVKEQTLIFKRRQKGKLVKIPLEKAAQDIIKKYDSSSETYLFPLIETYQGLLYYSISERVRKSMKKIGDRVGRPSLSFGSNIKAWQQIVSQLDLSSILLQSHG